MKVVLRLEAPVDLDAGCWTRKEKKGKKAIGGEVFFFFGVTVVPFFPFSKPQTCFTSSLSAVSSSTPTSQFPPHTQESRRLFSNARPLVCLSLPI